MFNKKINPNITYINSLVNELSYIFKQRSPARYLIHRFKWNYYPLFYKTTRFPEHVDIETCSHCQLRCPMCFQTVRDDVKNGKMRYDLFEKIMQEIALRKPYSIRLSWRGECLLHPEFKNMLRFARSAYDGNISFLTNGLKLDEELFSLLIDTQTDYIVVSADGVGETYEAVRRPNRFETLIENLKLLQRMKKQRKSKYPLVRINAVSIWFQGKELDAFKRVFSPLADKLLVGSSLNNFKELTVKHDPDRFCASPWQRLLVGWDGEVYPCCNDYTGLYSMGNIRNSSLMDIWHGQKAVHMRKLIKNRKRLSLQLCREMDCGVDENVNDHEEAFLTLLRRQVTHDFGDNSCLLKYLNRTSEGGADQMCSSAATQHTDAVI